MRLEIARRLDAGLESIFMKAIARPGACQPNALRALHRGKFRLCVDGGSVKNRVTVMHTIDHGVRRGILDGIQTDQYRCAQGPWL